MYRVSSFISHFAVALLAGIGVATLWVNIDPSGYYDLVEWRMFDLPGVLDDLGKSLTFGGFVADGLMSLFVFYLGKELWEAVALKRGALRGNSAGIPILGAAGGLMGAALAWIALSAILQDVDNPTALAGWTVPLGSDVVLGYLFARAVFGPASPAVHVLLLLTIAMDLAGMLILGLTHSANGLQLLWLALPLCAALMVWHLHGRHITDSGNERARQRAMWLWPYALAGAASWFGVAASGLPPALGLLPLLPAIPHAEHAFGMFAEAEEFLTDPLNRIAHLLIKPLVLVMFLFGLTHGGVDLAAFTETSVIVLGALWIGKPIGILAGALVLAPRLGFKLPKGMRRRDMGLIAGLAGIGFVVPALTIADALPGGLMQEAARIGLALSILAGFGTFGLSRLLRQRRRY
jgi:NhaA family Na+:H+ antiporter